MRHRMNQCTIRHRCPRNYWNASCFLQLISSMKAEESPLSTQNRLWRPEAERTSLTTKWTNMRFHAISRISCHLQIIAKLRGIGAKSSTHAPSVASQRDWWTISRKEWILKGGRRLKMLSNSSRIFTPTARSAKNLSSCWKILMITHSTRPFSALRWPAFGHKLTRLQVIPAIITNRSRNAWQQTTNRI